MTPQERGERAEHLGLLARRAQDGDRAALEGLLAGVRDDVYRLALRMTGRPADAEDATQEVLVKVLTRLGGWRGEARVTTWVHRVTVNHLLDRRRSAMEQAPMSFDDFGRDLLDGLAAPDSAFDDPTRSLTYDAVDGLPRFVRRATNRWTAEPDGANACVVRTQATLHLAWWMRPAAPFMAARLRRESVAVLEELAHHLETGRPHPRKATAAGTSSVAPTVER